MNAPGKKSNELEPQDYDNLYVGGVLWMEYRIQGTLQFEQRGWVTELQDDGFKIMSDGYDSFKIRTEHRKETLGELYESDMGGLKAEGYEGWFHFYFMDFTFFATVTGHYES